MADILPTQNASQQPLTLMMGTPPKPKDPSEVFSAQRELALAAEKGGRAPELMAWVEFSAEEDADSDDLAQLRRANPSYPHRTPLRAIRKLRRALSEDSFRREALGIWDDKSTPSVVPPSTWSSLADEHSVATRKLVLALDVSLDRDRASVALAGLRGDDLVHMELDELGGGVDWVVDWVVGRCETNPIVAMVIDAKGPASSLASELRRRLRKSRVPLLLLNSQEVTDACADWLDEVRAGRVRHIGQPQLTGPLHGARKLSVGERWVWNGKSETRDITPIRAVTLATWGVLSNRVRAERGKGVVMSW